MHTFISCRDTLVQEVWPKKVEMITLSNGEAVSVVFNKTKLSIQISICKSLSHK